MSKRKKFLISSLVLSLGFVAIQLIDNQYRIFSIVLLSALTAGFFAWSLIEGLGKNMTLLTLILPTLFTAGVGMFWFLLPVSIYARLPVVVFYGIGIYALGLTMNIFTVAAIRTIALLRAARGVGFVLTLVTSFLVYDAIISFKIPFWASSPLISLFSFPLLLQGFWTIPLEKDYIPSLASISLVSSLVIGEVALGLGFWPVTLVGGSLFLTVAVYILLGLGQATLEQRLFLQTIREYLLVGVVVFAGMLLATHWGG